MKKVVRRLLSCAVCLAAAVGPWATGALPAAQPDEAAGTTIKFQAGEGTPCFVMVRDEAGELVRCIASAAGPAGERSVVWQGRDSAGREVEDGTYQVFLSAGLEWELDRAFGNEGRLRQYVTEQVVQDPAAAIPVPGVLDRMDFNGIKNYFAPDLWPTSVWPTPVWIDRLTVNGEPYQRVEQFTGSGPTFVFNDGAVTINPATLQQGDAVKVVSYDTCFLENPWDLAVGEDGSLYVLTRWKGLPNGYGSSLTKLTPDGQTVDTRFGVDGEIPFIYPSHQVVLAPQDNRLYIAGSHWYSWGTGSFKLDSGAFWFYMGGSGNDPAAAYLPAGISLGEGNKLYLGDLKVYNRTRPLREGFLYAASVEGADVRPGPSMEDAAEADMFYLTGWTTGITKMQDTGSDVTPAYSLVLPHKTIGVSLDADRHLLFAGSRMPDGFVTVVYDDGHSLTEITRLTDAELGGIHTVRYHEGLLYVVEDAVAFSDSGREVGTSEAAPATSMGKNRISRYRLTYGPEQPIQNVEKK